MDTKLKQVNLAAMLFHNVLTKIKKKKEKLKTFSDDSFQNMFVNQPCSGRNYDVQIMNLFHNFIFLTQECLGQWTLTQLLYTQLQTRWQLPLQNLVNSRKDFLC